MRFEGNAAERSVRAKESIVEIGRRMYVRGFVAANDGNISARVAENEIIITPAGVSKGYMRPEMLVTIDMSGNVLEGTLKPSSELRTHLAAYAENPDIISVCHAHPPLATAYAVAGITLDLPVLSECVMELGEVPVVPYAMPGTEELARNMAPYCKTHGAVLLANHGAVTWDRDIFGAYFRMETLEHCCKIMLYSNHIIKRTNVLERQDVRLLTETRGNFNIKCVPKTGGGRKGIVSLTDFLTSEKLL